MATLAELEAQQAQLAVAFAQNDKDHVDGIVAALTDPAVSALIATLAAHMNDLGSASSVRKSTGELINVLTLLPPMFAQEAARLDALINPPAAPAPPA